MRLCQYLTEDISTSEKIELIKTNCNSFLNKVDINHCLYRGMWDDDVPNKFIPIKVNKNRTPRNTNKHIHNLFDLGFKSVYNIKARSECIFCTGNRKQTEIYGDTYIIFPIGKFECYWSPYIHDLFAGLNTSPKDDKIKLFLIYTLALQASTKSFDIMKVLNVNGYMETLKKHKIEPEINDILVKLKDEIDDLSSYFIKTYYNKGNIKDAIQSNNEIMIDCDEYYVLKYSKGIVDNIWVNLF